MTDPTATAEHLRQHAKISGKPVLASWMGGEAVEAGEQILNQAGIPTYEYPDTAAQVFTLMWRSSYNLQGLYETPQPAGRQRDGATNARERAEAIIAAVRREGRTVLTEIESKQLLAAYGIPTVKTVIAETLDAAVAAAEDIGYPDRPEAPLQDDHPQDRRGRRSAQPERRRRGAHGLPRHRVVGLPSAPAQSTSRASASSR